MAKDHCVYHAEKAANWNCVSCGTLLCQECFPAAPDPARAPYCALCGGNMHHLGVANSLPPFWSRTPRFFAYPFAPNGAIFLALLAVLTIASAKLFSTSSLIILLPIFITVSLVIRQGLRVIEFCSQGRSRPPSIAELFDGNPTTLKMLGLMLAYGMLVGALGRFGWFGIGAIVCVSLLLPASIMLLAIHGTLRDALDPIQLLQLAARTGWSYLGLVLLLIVTAQGPQQAIALIPAATLTYLAQHSPQVLLAMLVVSTAYFNMVMGAMMGYLLFQHHEDLGIRPDAEHAAAPADKGALELARAVILVREARYEDALRHMGGMVADYPHDLPVLAYHHKLLCETGAETERVVRHTERYLQTLLDQQRKSRMVAVLEAARRVVSHYQPASIVLRRTLAEEYFLQRQFKPAIALLAMLHKEAPASPDLPAACFLLARIYSEGLRDDVKAVMILDYVLQHCAGHAMADEIAHYRSVIRALGKSDQAGACAAS
ncbi:B-box zinc finger protein [Massilia sp. S19_KUP03_FR1]|uniref:B-box zinc finger protein n=1 Tax=Massilia sp. S19_KUP03_FR1 TaxID=3025503 RepID=UPI002FCD7BF8